MNEVTSKNDTVSLNLSSSNYRKIAKMLSTHSKSYEIIREMLKLELFERMSKNKLIGLSDYIFLLLNESRLKSGLEPFIEKTEKVEKALQILEIVESLTDEDLKKID